MHRLFQNHTWIQIFSLAIIKLLILFPLPSLYEDTTSEFKLNLDIINYY